MGASAQELFENCEGKGWDDLKPLPDAETEGIECVAAGGNGFRLLIKTPGRSVMGGEPVLEERWRRRRGGKRQLV